MNIFSSGRNSNVTMKVNGACVVNGKKINVPSGSSLSVINNKVYIDGKEYNEREVVEAIDNSKEIKIEITGDVTKLDAESSSVTVNGNVTRDLYVSSGTAFVSGSVNDIDAGNQCTINTNNITGDIDAGNMCTIKVTGDVKGKIDTGNMCTVTR